MATKVLLSPSMFERQEQVLVEHGSLIASTFRFRSGVCGLRLRNGRGELVLLPYQGQQIWSAQFDGRSLTMKSMFDEPRATQNYLDTYGGFLIHCGATAMGVPTADQNKVAGQGQGHVHHGVGPFVFAAGYAARAAPTSGTG